MIWSDIKKELLSNPEVMAEYENLQPEYEVLKALLSARKSRNLTQQELAERTGVNRSDISKLENGNSNPTIAILQRLADGMDMKLKLEFVPKNHTNQ